MDVFEQMSKYGEIERRVVYTRFSLDLMDELIDIYLNPKGKEIISKLEFGRNELGYPLLEVEYLIQ